MKILIGTNNKNKLKQFERIFINLDCEFTFLNNYGNKDLV